MPMRMGAGRTQIYPPYLQVAGKTMVASRNQVVHARQLVPDGQVQGSIAVVVLGEGKRKKSVQDIIRIRWFACRWLVRCSAVPE